MVGRRTLGAKEALGATTVALLWALCYPLITTAVEYAPPLHVGVLRAVLAGLTLVGWSVARGRPGPRGTQWIAVIAIGVTSTGLGFAGMFMAGGRVGPGLATVIANSQPLLAALIGYFALRERLTGRQAIGMASAFGGIALIAVRGFEDTGAGDATPAGILFVLLGAVGVAVGNVIMKRFAQRLDPLAATGWQLLIGSLPLFLVAAFWSSPGPIRWAGPFVGALAGLAIPGTAVAFALWFALMRRAPLNVLNVFSFLTPIAALAIGTLLYGERLEGSEIAGISLVLGGARIAARSKWGVPAARKAASG